MSAVNGTLTESQYSTPVLSIIVILMTAFSFCIVMGNVLVIYIYYKHKNLQIPKNFFILSLAIADVLIGTFSVNFYTLYLAVGHWPFGEVACDLWLSTDYSCCNASTLSLLAISIERYMSIRHTTFHRNNLTRDRLKKIITALWILSFSVWFPAVFAYPHIHGERTVKEGECFVQFLYENAAVTIVTAFINFYGPIILMTVIYILISLTLINRYKEKYDEKNGCNTTPSYIPPDTSSTATYHNIIESTTATPRLTKKSMESILTSSKESVNLIRTFTSLSTSISSHNNHGSPIKRKRANTQRQKDYLSHKRAVTFLLLIISAFAITWLPYHLMAVIAPFCKSCIHVDWWHFAYIFCYVNSLVNPFCYAFGNRHFKRYFKEIFKNLKDFIFIRRCGQKTQMDAPRHV